MPAISQRAELMPASPIRKLVPLAEAARARGTRIYHLNIGQPDLPTPQVGLDALKHIDRTVLEYSPSDGNRSLREKLVSYYEQYQIRLSPDDIIVTTGGSEAVLFAFMSCLNPGDEIIVPEPAYANYMAFAISAGAVIQDLTWKKEQEKALILKSVAIKEMHHRVKNNLQTIASLLRLQVRRSDNEETRKVLGESMNRILSIATTHELLAQSGVDQVKIGEVILNIKNNTVRYFARPHFDVNITLEGDDFEVDSDIATSVALIINELLQNSLQYAFQDREKGLVRIVVTRGELYSRIEVIDDGSGYDVENVRTDRLGLSIVQTMVKDKLRGTLDVESGPGGTHVTFEFKNQIMDAASVT